MPTQVEEELAATELEDVAAGQGVQTAWPVLAAYVPGRHAVGGNECVLEFVCVVDWGFGLAGWLVGSGGLRWAGGDTQLSIQVLTLTSGNPGIAVTLGMRLKRRSVSTQESKDTRALRLADK